ncbi:MAG TPA: flagellar basal body rod protein FlgB [Candidatus Aminicenantes bacterium]|nr:flagellar basal body rod protein FlgB [Candidatus Aminicenantes bacterium]
MKILDWRQVDLLERGLNISTQRNALIASNVANVDTPGYKSQDLAFTQVLDGETDRLALRRTDPRHLPAETGAGAGNEVVESTAPARADGNNVNIEDEMIKLSQNTMDYNISVQLLAKRLNSLKSVVTSPK